MWEPEEHIITALLKAYCASKETNEAEHNKIGKLLKDGYGIDVVLLKKRSSAKYERGPYLIEGTERTVMDVQESRVSQVKEMTDVSNKDPAIAAETRRRNKTEITENIRRLRAEYHVDIPRQIAAGVSEAQRHLLTARLMNIRNLLQDGYRVGLTENDNAPESIVQNKSPLRARVIPV